jgi:hypothetical protein
MPPSPATGAGSSSSPTSRRSFTSKLLGELLNGLLVLSVGIPMAGAAIYFISSSPLAAGPEFELTHECRYLDPKATQCWSHLKIVSLNDEAVTIKKVTVNGRKDCTPDDGIQAFETLMASQFINVTKKTIQKGDAYGVGLTCEPVDVEIETDKGIWTGGKRR